MYGCKARFCATAFGRHGRGSIAMDPRMDHAGERLMSYDTHCCIVGGGPAGMILALLLGRAGVQTTIFEEHEDFERDFRGDTVHPSTMELMDALGLADQVLALANAKIERLVFDG